MRGKRQHGAKKFHRGKKSDDVVRAKKKRMRGNVFLISSLYRAVDDGRRTVQLYRDNDSS